MSRVELETNIEDIKDDFPLLPAGKYGSHIESCEQDLAKSSGKPKLVVIHVIDEGEFAGRKFYDHVPLGTGWRVKQYTDLMGLTSGNAFDTADLVNAQAIITLNQEPGQDGSSLVNKITKVEKAA